MGKFDQPGYPLPDGELGNDEIVCQLVYLPDRAEYWQAFFAALHYMTTWRAWERDVDKRGKDAAANWRAAFELTMECWRMACLEGLQQDVSDILDHIRNTVPCCGDIVIYGDSTVYITTIIPGVGDDPTHYGETEVEDWDEWSEYLCYNAHLWIDELVKQSNHIELALATGGMSIGLAGFIVAAIVLFVVGGFLSGVVIMAIVAGTIAGYTANMFSDAADNIDAARDDIICSIMSGASLSDAVEYALSSGAAWDLFYSHLDYGTAIAILYEGGDGETFLEAETRSDCVCDWEDYYELRIDGPGTMLGPSSFEGELTDGCYEAGLVRLYRKSDDDHVPMNIILMSQITVQPCGGHKLYKVHDHNEPHNVLWDSDVAPTDLEFVGSAQVVRTNQFVMWLIWEPDFG